MLKFSFKHMLIRLGKYLLIAASIIITLTVSLLAYNIANQVKDGIVSSYKYFDTVVGPSGSQTQLVLNTLFYTDKPLGLIDYDQYEEIRKDRRVALAIPFAAGDNYNNARIIGTIPEYLSEFSISSGKAFEADYQAVIGCNTAKNNGLAVGDHFFSVHGLTTEAHSHSHSDEKQQYTVVGVLARTNTATDNVVFTSISTVWKTHGEAHDDEGAGDIPSDENSGEHEHEANLNDENSSDLEHEANLVDEYSGEHEHEANRNDENSGDHEHEANLNDENSSGLKHEANLNDESSGDHEHEANLNDEQPGSDSSHGAGHGGVTSILIKCTSFQTQMSFAGEYNNTPGLQAVNPSEVMRELINNVDMTRNIVYVLCGIILIMNLFIISIITMLNMYDVKKDIILLRLIGVLKGRIKAIVYIQNLIVAVISSLIGLLLSRILMNVIGVITQNMGIVLDTGKFYDLELLIIALVLVMTFLPIIIAINRIFAGKIIDEK